MGKLLESPGSEPCADVKVLPYVGGWGMGGGSAWSSGFPHNGASRRGRAPSLTVTLTPDLDLVPERQQHQSWCPEVARIDPYRRGGPLIYSRGFSFLLPTGVVSVPHPVQRFCVTLPAVNICCYDNDPLRKNFCSTWKMNLKKSSRFQRSEVTRRRRAARTPGSSAGTPTGDRQEKRHVDEAGIRLLVRNERSER